MAWQEVTITRKRQRRVGNAVGFGYGMKYGARIVIAASICVELGWRPGTLLRLLIGSGDHAGKLRLEPDADGVLQAKRTMGAPLWVLIGKLPQLVHRGQISVTLEHVIQGAALIVTMPGNTLVQPRAEIAQAHAAPTLKSPTPPVAPVFGRKIDVTSRLMGDPKPNGRPISRPPG